MDSTRSKEPNAPSSHVHRKLAQACEIRLLKLLPGIARLECELEHVTLSDAPPYEAVSYCWGASDFTETLHCGRGFLKITRNLHSALTIFRLENAARYLWVDAVCINQSDDAEKSLQVSIMAKIYSSAKICLIWIGDEDKLSGPTMAFLQILGQFAKAFTASERSGDIDLPLRSDLQDINQAREWDNLDSFFSRPWFSRRWVAQELCFAKSAVICCGTAIMDWEELDHSLLVMRHQFYKLERDLGQAWLTAQELIEYRRTCRNEFGTGPERLTTPLRWFSQLQCKDDRDRVFALLSLINEGQRVSYQPDYTKTDEEAYISFAEHCISHDNSLRILNLASSPLDHSPRDPGLPSWVPDWRRTFLTGSHLIGVFTAGQSPQGEAKTKPVVENLHLLIQGICLDEIRSSSVELEPSVTNASLKDHETHLRIWEAMFKSLGPKVEKLNGPT
jgi:hypothetical protein